MGVFQKAQETLFNNFIMQSIKDGIPNPRISAEQTLGLKFRGFVALEDLFLAFIPEVNKIIAKEMYEKFSYQAIAAHQLFYQVSADITTTLIRDKTEPSSREMKFFLMMSLFVKAREQYPEIATEIDGHMKLLQEYFDQTPAVKDKKIASSSAAASSSSSSSSSSSTVATLFKPALLQPIKMGIENLDKISINLSTQVPGR